MFRKLRQRPESLLKMGYAALIVASAAQWFLRPGPHFGAAAVDGAKGLLYGIAIGALLLGMRRRGRQSSPDAGGCGR